MFYGIFIYLCMYHNSRPSFATVTGRGFTSQVIVQIPYICKYIHDITIEIVLLFEKNPLNLTGEAPGSLFQCGSKRPKIFGCSQKQTWISTVTKQEAATYNLVCLVGNERLWLTQLFPYIISEGGGSFHNAFRSQITRRPYCLKSQGDR